ncbi:MAG: hypothetical protein PVH88_10990 [Ignavibacteria bacterium]|jgi:hypothetical protein
MGYKISNTAYGVAKARSVEMFHSLAKRLFDDLYPIKFLSQFTENLMDLMESIRLLKRYSNYCNV